MKKLIYSAAALAAMIFAGSCQQENLEPVAQESTVTFSVELPGVQTKAIGDGFNVDQLVYEVWKTESANERDLKDVKKATRLYQQKATMANIDGEQKTVISLNLVHDQNYTILFWAQNSKGIGNEPAYNTTDLTAVTYAKKLRDDNFNKGEYLSNNENMAAFYGVAFLEAADVEVPSTRRVELKRPFAQLNIGTKNTPTEYKVKMNKSRVKIANVPSVFDVAQNIAADSKKGTPAKPAVTDTLAFVYEYADLPTDPSTLTVNNIPYEYVAMNYIFADGNVEVQYWIDATLTATNPTNGRNETTNAVVYNRVPQVPLKENYRTNIVGNLLSSTTQYEVVIDASWEDVNEDNWDGNVEEVWDENYIQEPYFNAEKNQYEISLASELAWLAAKVNGMPYIDAATNSVKYEAPVKFAGTKFVLVEDIDLVGWDNDMAGDDGQEYELTWTPIGATGEFQGTFDGQNHTISNLLVKTEGTTPAGLFGKVKSATVKNVTVVNADVQGHGSAAVIVAHGVCAKIENCHVLDATVVSTPYEKDDANNVGGIVGYLSGESEAWVKNCTVENTRISAYRKVGGIAGVANQTAVVSGNTVKNSFVIADQTPAYKEYKAADLGEIVGYVHAKATVAENTAENVELTHKVKSVEELNNAAPGAFVTLGAGVYNLTDDVTVNEKPVQVKEGAVVINGTDYTITAGSTGDYAFITNGENASLVIDAKVASLGGGLAADNGAKIEFNGQGVDISKYTKSSPARYNIYASRGGEIVINSGTFKFNSTNNTRRSYVCVENGGKVIINGGTFGKASTRSGYTGIRVLDDQSEVIVTGGTFGFDPTEWVAAGYTAKKEGQNWVVVAVTADNLNELVATPGATVKVAAGEYTFPSSSIAEGVTIECAPGTVFTGNSKLNIKGATVIGAKFSNPSGSAVDQTINGTFKNCTFEGVNALRYAYAGETCVFENCVFSGSTYGAHFDGGANDVLFKNCTFSGFNAFGAALTLVTFDGCTFVGNGKSGYNGANLWGSAKMIDTEFVFDGTTTYEWIDMIGDKENTKTYEITDCTVTGDSVFNSDKFSSRNPGTKITIDGVVYTWGGGYLVDENGNVPTTTAAAMQAALNSGASVTLNVLNDIVGDVTVPQNADVNVVINGNDKFFDGMITVDGKSATYTTAGLTINNLIFNASTISADACINLGEEGNNNTRYTCNVTVNNCKFDVPGAVGVKSYTGGDKNLTISRCIATSNAHSLVQVKGHNKVLVDNCTINSKNGMNFNNSVEVTINECNADVKGYAARFGEGSAADTAAETYAITNSTLKSACEDGDAVIILRGTAANSTLTLTNTTLVGTTEITNNTNAQVIR